MNKIRLAYSISILMHIIAVAAVVLFLNPLGGNSNATEPKPATITYLIPKPTIKEILPNMGEQHSVTLPPLKINANNQLNGTALNPISQVNSTIATTSSTLRNIAQVQTDPLNYPKTVGNILPQNLQLNENNINITFQNNPRLLVSFSSVQDTVAKHSQTNGVISYLQRLARLLVGNNKNNNANNNTHSTNLTAHILVDRSGRVYSTNFIRRGLPIQENIAYDIIHSLRFNAESNGQSSAATITINIPL